MRLESVQWHTFTKTQGINSDDVDDDDVDDDDDDDDDDAIHLYHIYVTWYICTPHDIIAIMSHFDWFKNCAFKSVIYRERE